MTGSPASLPLYSGSIARNEALWARGLDAYPTSTSDALAATAEEAWVRNPTTSLFRALRRGRYDASYFDETGNELANSATEGVPRLSANEANERYGIAGHLTFSAETPLPVAEELYRLKRDELARQDVLARSPGGAAQFAGELAVGLGVSVLDPINVASAFVPVVSQARFAAWSAQSVSRARLMRGGIEGAAGAALVEPIVYGVAKAEQADYTELDSLLNIAFGTAMGGGLHVGLGALSDRFGAKAIEGRETHLRAAVADMVENGSTARSSQALARDLGLAYDRVLENPVGDPRATLATVDAGEVGQILVRHGAFKDINEIEYSRRGYGLVKVIWRHGERSAEPPEFRVTRDDVLALPDVVGKHEPIAPSSNPEDRRMAWVVDRPAEDGKVRRLVYAATRFDSPDGPEAGSTIVTIYVEKPGDRRLPVSRPKGAAGEASIPPVEFGADTQAGIPNPRTAETPPASKVLPENGAAAKAEPDKLPYVKVPAAPASLARFVRANGLKDVGGDVAAIAGGRRQARGLIDAKNGKHLDEAARLAWEAGYFPEHPERIDINTFLDALSDDLSGKPRYRGADAEAIAERNHALAVNEEIDRLAGELGIKTRGKTYGQFFDEVAERVSAEEAQAEAVKMADAIQAEYDRLAAGRKAFLEQRGEAWEPDVFADPVHAADHLERDHEAGFRQGDRGRASDAGAARPADRTAQGASRDPGQGEARPGDGGDRGVEIADPELRAEADAAERDLEALIRAGLPADDPELQAVQAFTDRVNAEARARDMAAFCLGRNA